MTKERLEQILNNILDWGVEHDNEFMEALVSASDMTLEEAKELEVEEYHEDYEDRCNLPDEITLSIEDDLGLTDIDDENAVNEEIASYIDEHYPVSADDWEWEVGDDCSEIVVYNIKWNEEQKGGK